jgi:hypothetical protein
LLLSTSLSLDSLFSRANCLGIKSTVFTSALS